MYNLPSETTLTFILLAIVMVLAFLYISRAIVLWYFGIDAMLKKQQEQIDYLKRIADQLAPIQQQAPTPPPQPTSQPTSQPQRRTPGRYTLQQRP